MADQSESMCSISWKNDQIRIQLTRIGQEKPQKNGVHKSKNIDNLGLSRVFVNYQIFCNKKKSINLTYSN